MLQAIIIGQQANFASLKFVFLSQNYHQKWAMDIYAQWKTSGRFKSNLQKIIICPQNVKLNLPARLDRCSNRNISNV